VKAPPAQSGPVEAVLFATIERLRLNAPVWFW
jgi:hypothetical protein